MENIYNILSLYCVGQAILDVATAAIACRVVSGSFPSGP